MNKGRLPKGGRLFLLHFLRRLGLILAQRRGGVTRDIIPYGALPPQPALEPFGALRSELLYLFVFTQFRMENRIFPGIALGAIFPLRGRG